MSGGLVLAIDTTTEWGSLALADQGVVIAEQPLRSGDGYGHILFAGITSILSSQHVALQEIALFAAAAGPGTFTGVRVGLAAAKGLAAALGKPAAGVSNLRALALLGTGSRRAAVLDARRGEIFGGLFDGAAAPLAAEAVAPLETWLATLPDEDISFVFNDPAPYADNLNESRFAASPRIAAGDSLAGAIARLAWDAAGDPMRLDANYVRRSDAELAWTDRS